MLQAVPRGIRLAEGTLIGRRVLPCLQAVLRPASERGSGGKARFAESEPKPRPYSRRARREKRAYRTGRERGAAGASPRPTVIGASRSGSPLANRGLRIGTRSQCGGSKLYSVV